MRARAGILVLAVTALATPLSMAAGAAETNPGREAYLKYCSACHGSDGKGDGVVSGAMQPRPSDLTSLAAAHGGTFPIALVRDVIDGRKHLPAHGNPNMPVWGEVFTEEKAAAQGDAHVRGRVQLIADYIKSIQR